jgi:hypothetical protein
MPRHKKSAHLMPSCRRACLIQSAFREKVLLHLAHTLSGLDWWKVSERLATENSELTTFMRKKKKGYSTVSYFRDVVIDERS